MLFFLIGEGNIRCSQLVCVKSDTSLLAMFRLFCSNSAANNCVARAGMSTGSGGNLSKLLSAGFKLDRPESWLNRFRALNLDTWGSNFLLFFGFKLRPSLVLSSVSLRGPSREFEFSRLLSGLYLYSMGSLYSSTPSLAGSCFMVPFSMERTGPFDG